MKATSEETPSARADDGADAIFTRRMEAVSAAVSDFHAYLLDYLHRLTGQWQDAENLAQDLWRYVLLNFEESQIHALPLLRRKAYQLFIDHYRRQTRRGEILSESVPDTPAPPPANDFTNEAEAALRERFWSEYPGIELTDPQKEALWLHARYGFTCKEIEGLIAVPSSTVGDWIALGRRRLAERINLDMKGTR
jgi:DNA-directed RNA polymerase specialized sigma24 family protein